MADNLCSECVEDTYLRAIIEQEGEPDQCDACDKPRPSTISIARLGELLEPVLREHYRQGDDLPRFYDENDHADYEQDGDDLAFIIQETLGQYFDFEAEIVRAVIDAENCWPQDGDIPFFDDSANYVARPTDTSEIQHRWDEVKRELATNRRFFSSSAKDFFDDLFASVDVVKTAAGESQSERRLVTTLPTDTLLFRGRIAESHNQLQEMFTDPYTKVGPPPPEKARAGRMNAEGIPVLYCSGDYETCLAELRPALGGSAAVITLRTTAPLQILDFTRMNKAYKNLSYFQPDFAEQSSHTAFIRRLGHRISRPIVPGNEPEYLITQVMIEYLAHVDHHNFAGVRFSSAQRKEGKNLVLFASVATQNSFPVQYIPKSIKAYRTNIIQYTHETEDYKLENGELRRVLDPWD